VSMALVLIALLAPAVLTALLLLLVASLRGPVVDLRAAPHHAVAGWDGGVPDRDGVVHRTLRRARHRTVVVLATASVVLVVGALVDALAPERLGLPLALSPGLAATVALLLYAALPLPAPPPARVATASLTRRTARSVVTRRSGLLLAGLAAAFLGFLGWAAAVAVPDDLGRARSYGLETADRSAAAGPFPGASYGLPLAAVTVLLLVATLVALHRIASTPVLPDPDLASVDRHWREASARVVLGTATAALIGYAGATVAFAGIAVRSVLVNLADTGIGPSPVVGTALALSGVLALLAGAAVAGRTVLVVVTLPGAILAATPGGTPTIADPARPGAA